MRPFGTALVLLLATYLPASAQNTSSPVAPDTTSASVDYTALRDQAAAQNKTLIAEVSNQRAIVKKNQELLKEAEKLHTANLKLADEKKKLEALTTDLEHRRDALKTASAATAAAH